MCLGVCVSVSLCLCVWVSVSVCLCVCLSVCLGVQVNEYEHLSKGQTRVAYTRRMMEIIANIQKQKEDIGRILADTRKVGRRGGGRGRREGERGEGRHREGREAKDTLIVWCQSPYGFHGDDGSLLVYIVHVDLITLSPSPSPCLTLSPSPSLSSHPVSLLFRCLCVCVCRQVQKEINQLTGKLDRVFTMTDEQVYKDARKDEARRQAYKLLASLREVGVDMECVWVRESVPLCRLSPPRTVTMWCRP